MITGTQTSAENIVSMTYGMMGIFHRQSNKPQAQSMLSMLDSEYMDMDASVAASEKEVRCLLNSAIL